MTESDRDDGEALPLENRIFRVGQSLVDPIANRITRAGHEHHVEPLVMDVLVDLATHQNQVVSRQDLLARYWPEHVTEDALNRVIWKIRKALEDDDNEIIETVPKRGYRLTAGVVVAEPPDAPMPSLRRVIQWSALVLLIILGIAGPILVNRGTGTTDASHPLPAPRETRLEFVPLTSMEGYESSPALWPNGRRLAFQHFAKSGESPFQWDLYVTNLSDADPTRLTATPEHELNPSWTPDGTEISFVRVTDDSCMIMQINPGTGEERPITPCGPMGGAPITCCPSIAWMPDGSAFVFSDRSSADVPQRLYLHEIGRGQTVMLTDPPLQSFGDSDPSISLDGSTVAFVRSDSRDVDDVWTLDLAQKRETRVTSEGHPIRGVDWSANGATLIFGSRREGTFRLWRVPAWGGPIEPVVTVGMNATSPEIDSDGISFVYEEWNSEINLWRVSSSFGESIGTRLVGSTRWDWRPQISPDGSRLAFLSNREGPTEVYVADVEGRRLRKLTNLSRSFATVLQWSPDSAKLVLTVPDNGNLDVFVLDVETGRLDRVTRDASAERAPNWSRDGTKIYFGSNRSGRWEIWRTAIDGSAPSQQTSDGGFSAFEAPDGRHIFYIKPGEDGIWKRLINGRSEERLVSDMSSVYWMNWHVDSTGIVYVGLDERGIDALKLYDFSSGEATVIATLDGDRSPVLELYSDSGLTVHPVTGDIIVAAVDRSDSDLWLARGK